MMKLKYNSIFDNKPLLGTILVWFVLFYNDLYKYKYE